MTDQQILPRLLAAELDRLEGDMAQQLQGATPHHIARDEGYIQAYGRLLELQAMVSSRHVEVANTQEPQEPSPDRQPHSEEVMNVVNALIRYHESNSSLRQRIPWGMTDHRYAAETLKLIRDHLDCCYEIRS